MDYDTRTHHSNMDVYDRIQRADMEQMAVIEARSFITPPRGPTSFLARICPRPRPVVAADADVEDVAEEGTLPHPLRRPASRWRWPYSKVLSG